MNKNLSLTAQHTDYQYLFKIKIHNKSLSEFPERL